LLHSYLVALGALVGLYLVIDISSNLSGLVEQTTFLGLLPLIARVYATQLPLVFKELSPAVLLVGAAFTLTELGRNNELLPIKASGTSIFRVLRPVFLAAVLLTLLSVLDQEVVIPALAGPISWGEAVTRAEPAKEASDICITDSFNNIFSFYPRAQVKDDVEMEDLYLFARYDDGKMKLDILGAHARWQRSADGIYRWHLSGGVLVKYDREEQRLDTLRLGEGGYLIEPAEAQPEDEFQIRTDLVPRDFENAGRPLFLHSLSELNRRLNRSPDDVFLNVELHRRYAFPLTSLILLMIGMPLVLRSEVKNRFLGAGFAIVLFAGYYALAFFCTELGTEGTIAPAAAAWLPVLIFGAVGVLLLDAIKT
jgi:lipopolysaccharide export system permease protein